MRLGTGLLLVGALAVTGMTFRQSALLGEMAEHLETLSQKIMDPLVTTWTDTENLTHTVTTTKKDGQTKAEWIADHEETVALMKAAFPPAA